LAELPESVGRVVPAIGSAGIEYKALVDGSIDFLMYWRTLPWDHAPGSLIVQEAGLYVARLDGEPYRPGDGGAGLLAASPDAAPAVAAQIAAALSAESN
jgi:fructose-1,6-bisphosphatase/inositol monophosphatase family enzyme